MSKITKKPKWGKPKLIVLTRGKPEERVLVACKELLHPGSSSIMDDNYLQDPLCVGCDAWGAEAS